jgi:uncharacterized membrane protein YeaQ/YmgE (transglycosylase-associated protein family)
LRRSPRRAPDQPTGVRRGERLYIIAGLTNGRSLSKLARHMDFSAHSILWILFIGLVIGFIAKLLMPGKDPGGCIITMLIGIAGAFIASYLGQKIGWYQPGEPASFIGSVVGAMLLLLLYRLIAPRRN